MKREKQEQLLRAWKQLNVDVALLKIQIETLQSTIGQQDYSSLKFTEKAEAASNKLCGLLNDMFVADSKHGKSLLGIMKNSLQLQNDLSQSIKTIRNYGESLKSESLNLLRIHTRVGMLMSYLNETRNKIDPPSQLAKLSTFAKSVTEAKRKTANEGNLAIQPEAPKRQRHK